MLKEKYARKSIYNGCSMQIENLSLGIIIQASFWQTFQAEPHLEDSYTFYRYPERPWKKT